MGQLCRHHRSVARIFRLSGLNQAAVLATALMGDCVCCSRIRRTPPYVERAFLILTHVYRCFIKFYRVLYVPHPFYIVSHLFIYPFNYLLHFLLIYFLCLTFIVLSRKFLKTATKIIHQTAT